MVLAALMALLRLETVLEKSGLGTLLGEAEWKLSSFAAKFSSPLFINYCR
jgi:hypothetical protein